jgi:PAS domain S-box-containing protein
MQRHGYTEDTWFTWSYSPIWDEDGKVGGMFCACTEETGRVLAERDRDRLLAQVESERARLAEAFAQSPSFLAILRGPDHVFEYANERYLRLIGGRRNVLGKPARKALPEVEGQGFFEILDRVFSTGQPFVGTGVRLLLQRQADRPLEAVYCDFVYQPLRGPDGSIIGILADGVDVTERHQAEARDRFLLSLEDALRPLSDPEQIPRVAAEMLGSYVNADRCAYADVDPDGIHFNLVGDYARGVPSMVGRYRLADFGAEFERCIAENRPCVIEDSEQSGLEPAEREAYRAARIRAMAAAPLSKAGRFVGGMALHQATPRRWGASDLELLQHVASRCYESLARARIERALRESESRFRHLADAMPQIVFTTSPDGEISYFNKQWYEYTGLPAGETAWETWRQVHSPEGLERVSQAWPEALRTGQPYELEFPLRRHDGAFRWHLARAVPIREGGRITRWFGTATDIHDRKQIEDALAHALRMEQEARGEAERASRMKDEFLATLSHELRTPLNAILGWSHMMRREGAALEELRRGAEVIERNARSQATIIQDLLDMSAIVSGKVRLEMEPVDVAGAVRAALETARPTAEAKQVRIQAQIDPAAGGVTGDADRLQQVLWNLLSNAIKFTPRGGRIEVAVARADGHVRITVADTGQGILPDFLPYVFDRFRQADASSTRRHGGLGLGLSIVKQLVELHGGQVAVESPGAGQGSTFTVLLPIREAAAAAAPQAGARGDALPAPTPLSREEQAAIAGKRILVVDDEPDARELVKRLLEECGARVTTAGSSDEALAIAAAREFDLLVSDIGMPGKDGHELMRALRALGPGGNGDLPAIALTAYARPEDRVKAIRAGFRMHAAKPVEPAELVAMVASLARAPAPVEEGPAGG